MKLRDATLAAHAGIPESASEIAPHVEPLYQTSVYDFPSIEASLPALAGQQGHVYARHGLPNSDALGRAAQESKRMRLSWKAQIAAARVLGLATLLYLS